VGDNFPAQVGEATEIGGVPVWFFSSDSSGLCFSRALKRWLDHNLKEFDVVHVHGRDRFPTTYGAWLARKKRVPYLMRPAGSLDPLIHRQSAKSLFLKRFYERLFELPNLQAASAIHYTAEEERDRAGFLKLKAPAVIIPNALDWKAFEFLPARGLFREKIGLTDDVPLILFLGRLNFKKGLDLLIPAFASLRESIPDAHLAIVGPDNEGYGSKVRGWCRERSVEGNVTFVDHLPQDEVIQAYVDADVFVLASYTENFGMTVVEAMACACPVVI